MEKEYKEEKQSEKIINVAFSSDNKYVKQLGISMISLFENNKNKNIKIYIIDNGIEKENKIKIDAIAKKYGSIIKYYNFEELTKGLKTDKSFPVSAFGRIFLTRINEIDKIIYFDCDSIIAGSIENLYNLDISNYYLAGVQDNVSNFYKELIGMNKNDRYINSGMMVLNLKKWRKDNITEKCLEFIKRYNGSVPHHDQGTINGVCKDKILIIHPKYNVQSPMFTYTVKKIKKLIGSEVYYSQKEIDEAIEKPVFIHYTAGFFNRPWNKNCTHPLKNIYLKYMNESEWRGQLDNIELTRNVIIMKCLYKILPFNLYYVFNKIINKRKEKRLKRRYQSY